MEGIAIVWLVVAFVGLIWFWNSLYVIKEWERGVVLRLGRLTPIAKGAGLRLVFWPVETLYRISLRIETLDVPAQDVITRDNVSVKVNAVCYFRVVDANLALSQVQNYLYATSQLAQTTLRSVVGQFELDQVLSEREKVNSKLQVILDQDTEAWGIKVSKVEVKQVDIPGKHATRNRQAGRSGTRTPRENYSRVGRIRSVGKTGGSCRRTGHATFGDSAPLSANFDGDWRGKKHYNRVSVTHRYSRRVDEINQRAAREVNDATEFQKVIERRRRPRKPPPDRPVYGDGGDLRRRLRAGL